MGFSEAKAINNTEASSFRDYYHPPIDSIHDPILFLSFSLSLDRGICVLLMSFADDDETAAMSAN